MIPVDRRNDLLHVVDGEPRFHVTAQGLVEPTATKRISGGGAVPGESQQFADFAEALLFGRAKENVSESVFTLKGFISSRFYLRAVCNPPGARGRQRATL